MGLHMEQSMPPRPVDFDPATPLRNEKHEHFARLRALLVPTLDGKHAFRAMGSLAAMKDYEGPQPCAIAGGRPLPAKDAPNVRLTKMRGSVG
jgi:hypothetical protein